jgi:glycosyltransferase involved in cell wall biosynthesis
MTYHQVLVSSDLGGAGLVALGIATELGRRSQAARVWVPGDGRAVEEARRLGLATQCYNARLLSQSRAGALMANLHFYRKLGSGHASLIHVHSPHAYRQLLPCLLFSRMARVAHVQIDEPIASLKWAFRLPPDLIVTCAQYLVDSVRRALPCSLQETQWIEAVPNAVDTRRFHPGDKPRAKQRVGAALSRPLALVVANLAPHKGQETAIRAVAILKQSGVAVDCWLAGVERGGGTVYTDRLQALIDDLRVQDCVRLLGHRDDIDLLLQAADFFLLPSKHEGLPLSILEAQATRVPVLAAPTAGVPEIVSDGESGFLIAAGDADGYAHRIRLLLANPELADRVAEGGFVRATRDFTWATYGERMIELYGELLERRRRRPHRRLLGDIRRCAALH